MKKKEIVLFIGGIQWRIVEKILDYDYGHSPMFDSGDADRGPLCGVRMKMVLYADAEQFSVKKMDAIRKEVVIGQRIKRIFIFEDK